eukprot:10753491-Lingulodinium_polyedra.AAC.1
MHFRRTTPPTNWPPQPPTLDKSVRFVELEGTVCPEWAFHRGGTVQHIARFSSTSAKRTS